jgi:hypothetical protein
MKPSLVFIVALAAGASTQVQAEGGQHAKVAEACKTEIQQLCQGQKGKELEQCLRTNDSKLSAQCKGALPK